MALSVSVCPRVWGSYCRPPPCLVKAMVFPVVTYGCESRTVKKAEHQGIDSLNCGVGEDSCESLGLQGDTTSPS